MSENFLATLGYSLNEIVGKHHSMFADAAYANSPEYRAFWDRLNRGEFVADKFRRLGKGGMNRPAWCTECQRRRWTWARWSVSWICGEFRPRF